MSFRARGFEREIWGGTRGFVSIGLKLFWFEQRTSYQQHPGRKYLAADRRGINTKWNYCGFPCMISYQQRPGGKFLRWIEEEINMKIKLSLVSLYEFSRPRFREGDLGWKSWFCIYWLKTLLIREENFLPVTSGRKVSGGGSKRN